MNIGLEEKRLEGVSVHLNDTKVREASHKENQNATKEIDESQEKAVSSSAVVLQISKNEEENSDNYEIRNKRMESVDEKKTQDKPEEISRQQDSFDMIVETQKKLLENFNI